MLTEELNLLVEHQEEMVKQGELRAYQGLCMQEAALLREYGKNAVDEETKKTLFCAANNAMERALKIDISLNTNV